MKKVCFLWLLIALMFSSCARWFNPSVMMRTKKNYDYTEINDSISPPVYTIRANDQLNLQLYAKKGFRIIDQTSLGTGNNNAVIDRTRTIAYLVEKDGMVKLPIIGRVRLDSLTLKEAESLLEERYSLFYNEPFVILRVPNKRATIFPGRGGSAVVVTLENDNISVLEALAQAGGISTNGKAHRVKLIRGDLTNPEVYFMNLSTMEGVKAANLIVEPGDIIYVDPSLDIQDQIISNISQILGIISTTIVTVLLINQIN